jgi:hypothetical protein
MGLKLARNPRVPRTGRRLRRQIERCVRHPIRAGALIFSWLCGRPAQNGREIRLFQRALLSAGARAVRIFEWGLGNSTITYTSTLARAGREFEWHGVDHSPEWFQYVTATLARTPQARAVHLACVPFQHPMAVCFDRAADHEAIEQYVEQPRGRGTFDVILIDGRFRRRCLLTARDLLAPDGIVLLHDAHRSYYHAAFSAYPYGSLVSGGRRPASGKESLVWLGATTAGGAAVIRRLTAEETIVAPAAAPR